MRRLSLARRVQRGRACQRQRMVSFTVFAGGGGHRRASDVVVGCDAGGGGGAWAHLHRRVW